MHTDNIPCEGEGPERDKVATGQGKSMTTTPQTRNTNHKKLSQKPGAHLPSQTSEGTSPDLGLPASRTIRQYISVV
jgi:hypothetical protein